MLNYCTKFTVHSKFPNQRLICLGLRDIHEYVLPMQNAFRHEVYKNNQR